MKFRLRDTERSKLELGLTSLMCSVSGSPEATVMALICLAGALPLPPSSPELERCRSQFNCTAAASSTVPSLNVIPGRRRSVQFVSVASPVMDSAMCGWTVFVVASVHSRTSYRAVMRLPSVMPSELLVRGARLMTSERRPMTSSPPDSGVPSARGASPEALHATSMPTAHTAATAARSPDGSTGPRPDAVGACRRA